MGRVFPGVAGDSGKPVIEVSLKQTTYRKGRTAEDIAYKYLIRQGFKLLARNYRSRRGEIDLIMRDEEIIVFIEVRSRKDNRTMNVVESIDSQKRARIIQTSQQYLQSDKNLRDSICRFDIVLVKGQLESAEIEWIKNAFET